MFSHDAEDLTEVTEGSIQDPPLPLPQAHLTMSESAWSSVSGQADENLVGQVLRPIFGIRILHPL